MIRETAPAKINLYLHVGARRGDGLHALESLFVFADGGDVVSAAPADELSLEITGPFAGALSKAPIEENLIMRAARALKERTGVKAGARFVLEKKLPIASGVGGGSSDAAAALRVLLRLWRVEISVLELNRLAFSLGADVPACLERSPVYVGGAGERLEPGPVLPPLWACLVHPKVAMPTGAVFRDFDAAHPSPPPPRRMRLAGGGHRDVTALMETSRNDLQSIAIRRQSVIQLAVERLAGRPGALCARMSGSGATVFGLFSSASAAARAAKDAAGRGWWSLSAPIAAASRRSPGAAV